MNENLSYLLFFLTGAANSDQNSPIFSSKQITIPGMDVGHTSDTKGAQVQREYLFIQKKNSLKDLLNEEKINAF